MVRKNEAAVALAKKRWAGVSKAERSKAARIANKARQRMPAAKRQAIARKAAKARWAKKRESEEPAATVAD